MKTAIRIVPVWFAWLAIAATAAEPAARDHAVRISEEGVLIVDGKRVFPIALTMPPPHDGKAPDGRPAFAVLREAGITFIRSGPVGKPWSDAAIDHEQLVQDAAARHGLRAMPFLKELADLPDDRPGVDEQRREAMLRRVLARFKDHPGMGVWKGADEPEWGKLPVAGLVRAYSVIKEVDPRHPVWIVQAPRGTVETLRPYDPGYDIVGADIYPVGYPPGMHSLRPNKEISMVGDYTQIMRQVAGGRKPVWMTLQIAWSGVTKPGKTLRMPTLPQQRFMTWQAIINGGRGLVYFGGHLPQAWNERDADLAWNWSFWNKVLRPVIEEIGPSSPLHAALVAPESNLKLQCSAEGVEWCVREVGREIFILACKREGQTVQAKFTGLPEVEEVGSVLYEDPRTMKAAGGAFTDWFAPFDVHVYRFKRI